METSNFATEKTDVEHLQNASEKSTDGVAPSIDVIRPSFADIDEKKLLRKMDVRLIPMLALLYLLSYLDRGNIGNAKIEGLQEDLHMTSSQYNWCLTAFFFTYAAFEVPSNVLLKKLRPSRWIPFIMVCWGTVMTLMGVVQSYHGLLIARIFLGVAEAGLFPGVAYYLTLWYRAEELQFRQALFVCAASFAGAFGGILAFGISHMDGVGGYEGWRWIFILEGIVTVLVAFSAFFLLYDFPDSATFLTEEERAFVIYRLRYRGKMNFTNDPVTGDAPVAVSQTEEFKWKYIKAAFKDWQVWVSIFTYWGVVCPLYGIGLFIPSIIKGLGYTSSTSQLLTVPVYASAALTSIAAAWFSDRLKRRSPFILGSFITMAMGFTMCIASSNPKVVYGGIFVAAASIYPTFVGTIAWLSNNLSGSYKRGAGMAIQIGIGNLAGAMASNFYRAKDAPRYRLGHALELGFIGIGITSTVICIIGYSLSNKKREKLMAEGVGSDLTPEELAEEGDKAVNFRYML